MATPIALKADNRTTLGTRGNRIYALDIAPR